MKTDEKQDNSGTGTFLGVPYDWRRPTWARMRARAWNTRDRHLLTPKSFGWGYDLNLHELLVRLGIVRRR